MHIVGRERIHVLMDGECRGGMSNAALGITLPELTGPN